MTPGTSIGPYTVLRHLGSGGMGEVWLAVDHRLDRQVALKMVRPAAGGEPEAHSRLMREARAAAALNHPNIATVHDVLEREGEVIIVFEHVEGDTLQSRIRRGPVEAEDALRIASQIGKALAAAHAHGIVHRDLKPANVIVGADGHVKVLDFGIARILAVGTTETNPAGRSSTSGPGFIGTPSYAAPEQMVSSAVDERADLYALGVVLFEMISGQRPFAGSDPVELAHRKLGADAPPLSSTGRLVPPALEQLVSSLLARDRDQRPPNATAVVVALEAIAGAQSTVALPPSKARVPVAATAMLLTLSLIVVALWDLQQRAAPRPSSAPPVVAVMPLANVSGDASRDFVAAGIAENLIGSIANLPTVTVLSRASVAEARSRFKDHSTLVKDLGATYLVEGSVQEVGGTLKVAISLVRPDRSVAWADSVEGKFQRILELQSQLASALTAALVVRVSASERQAITEPSTTNPMALEAYWQGKAFLERVDVEGNVDAAIAVFERAAQLDDKWALSRAGLGQAYRRKYVESKDPRWAKRAVDEAMEALRLAPDSAEVRYLLALTLAGAGRLDDAIGELHRAIAIRPNYDDARRQLGLLLADSGQIEAAIPEFQKAIALRPSAPSSYTTMGYALLQASRYQEAANALQEAVRIAPDIFAGYQQLGTAYQLLGETERALENYQKAIAIRPSAPAYSNIGALLHQKGDFQGAVDAYQKAIAIRPNAATTHRNLADALSRLGRHAESRREYFEAIRLFETDLHVNPGDARAMILLAVVLQRVGRPESAREYVRRALALMPESPDVLYRAATVSALAGDADTALNYLRQAFKRGYSKAFAAKDDELDSLRANARFQALLREEP